MGNWLGRIAGNSNNIGDSHSGEARPVFRTWDEVLLSFDFARFRDYMFDALGLSASSREELAIFPSSKLYSIAPGIGISSSRLAEIVAEFSGLPYLPYINPDDIQSGVLSPPFCRSHHVVPIGKGADRSFVISNPFDWELLETLRQITGPGPVPDLKVSEPENIEGVLDLAIARWETDTSAKPRKVAEEPSEEELEKYPILKIADGLFERAVSERASDIHIEPKESKVIIRFRIDGDLHEAFSLTARTGAQLISRLKLVGGLDIAQSRVPQDGAFMLTVGGKDLYVRLSSTHTPNGESLAVRLLEPYAKAKSLEELGMTPDQATILTRLVSGSAGSILVVGPTGSGKTTTIYALLHLIDHRSRSLLSVEDPVEYRIPFANQQQVNEKAGVTFDALLKAAVRQDPDVLFVGEVRDQYSARVCMDFASTGHLTLTSLHTSNAVTAIGRLERLGITRGVMADSIVAVVAQRLLKKLCTHCKEIAPITEEEADMLATFTDRIPSVVAHPAGCARCNGIGYYGREGVYEVLVFDGELSEMVRSGCSISEIRSYARNRGDSLISDHVLAKVENFTYSVKDAYEKVLLDDIKLGKVTPRNPQVEGVILPNIETSADPPILAGDADPTEPASFVEDVSDRAKSILIVDDDDAMRKLIAHVLEKKGYKVSVAGDGIDAMLHLDRESFDLVISDVNMPNLDGFKLIEVMANKGITSPVIFLTVRDSSEDEKTGLALGACDYIRKPIQKDVLLLRVEKILGRQEFPKSKRSPKKSSKRRTRKQ